MLKTRKFNLVLVGEDKGTGVEKTQKIDKVITYDGKPIKVKL